ncbi:MAG: rhodanese-like domain-containing protein [Acidobacteria bacterium]|nr:rhodanese-like domain-containing protein [Acidobacteriota bacterium]
MKTTFTLIDATELAGRLRDTAPPRVWNVLTDEYFDGRLIPGSRRVPLDQVGRTAQEGSVRRDAEIVVYCSGITCPQSRLAGEKLVALGYTAVRVFEGGLEAWEAAGGSFVFEEATLAA